MERCSESLIIREMQVKMIRGYYLVAVKMAITKKQGSVGKDVDKKQPYSVLLEMWIGGNGKWDGGGSSKTSK